MFIEKKGSYKYEKAGKGISDNSRHILLVQMMGYEIEIKKNKCYVL
jgi:hypothetical protein